MADELTAREVDAKPGVEQAAFWLQEIERGKRFFKKWHDDSKRVIKRYRNDRATAPLASGRGEPRRFNILWSNVQTTRPVIYGRTPMPEVQRRFKDPDPVGRVASQVLQRALEFAVDEYDFDEVMKNAVEDMQLTGRGQVWIRYNAETEERRERIPVTEIDGINFTADGRVITEPLSDDGGLYVDGESFDEKTFEEVVAEYLHWDDFLHSPARIWDEVLRNGWVARRSYMTRDELVDRFGAEIGREVKLTARSAGNVDEANIPEGQKNNLAVVWEIWNRPDRKIRWVSDGYDRGLLDEEDDPLNLGDFFPCPKPLMGTTTNDSMVPVPDFLQYEDQARELDTITTRIDTLTTALRVAGLYDASSEEALDQLLDGSNKNVLVPVRNWAAATAKGGIEGMISFFPLDQVVIALQMLYEARDRAKQTLYEVTGIADIIRGQSAPSETLGAQRIKGRFAALRLDEKQRDVARFARDILRLKAEIISEQFEPETLAFQSGVTQMREAQTNPQFMALFEQGVELLRNDVLRGFRIDIETDSTVVLDEEEEKQSRIEFLQSAGAFLQQAVEVAQLDPRLMPLLGEMLLFGIKGFRAGRQLESTFEEAIQALSGQQPGQAGGEDQAAAQAEAQIMAQKAQLDAQMKQAELQSNLQLKAAELQGNQQLKAAELQGNQALQAEKVRGELEIEAAKAANQQAL